jgi:hypothetical protein
MAQRMSIAALACLFALGVCGAARAQSPGDAVRIETAGGVVEGTLVDRLPGGYLVNKGKTSEVVPYAKVKAISRVGPAAAPVAPPAVPAPPAAPVVAPAPEKQALPDMPPPSLYVPPRHGLVDDPFLADEPAPAGTEPPPPPPPPAPMAQPLPTAAPLPPSALPPPPVVIPEIKTHRRSTAVMATGVALFGAGVITASVGALVFLNAGSGSTSSSNDDKMNNGIIASGVGAAAVAVGIVLWAVGNAPIPDADKPPARAEALKPTFAIGPGSAAMMIKF